MNKYSRNETELKFFARERFISYSCTASGSFLVIQFGTFVSVIEPFYGRSDISIKSIPSIKIISYKSEKSPMKIVALNGFNKSHEKYQIVAVEDVG